MTRLILPQIAEDFPEFFLFGIQGQSGNPASFLFYGDHTEAAGAAQRTVPGTAGTGAPGAHPPAGGWHTACLFGGPAASDRAG